MFLALVIISNSAAVSFHSLVMMLIMAEITGSVVTVGMITGVIVPVPRMIYGRIIIRVGRVHVVFAVVGGWIFAVDAGVGTAVGGGDFATACGGQEQESTGEKTTDLHNEILLLYDRTWG
jgi:hypothetical protein